MKRLFLGGVALCLMLTSCYSEIDFGELMPEPVAVINAIASPDTVVIASISRTYSIGENTNELYVKDADVRMTVNGNYSEQLTMVEYDTISSGYTPMHVVAYVSTYRPQPGDHIEITASTPYGEARCSDVVPNPVGISGVKTTLAAGNDDNIAWGNDGSYITTKTYDATYHVQFHDPAGVANYYLVNVTSDYYLYTTGVYVDYIDPLFEMQNQDITNIGSDGLLRNGWGWTFSDETIDGMDYSLSLKETGLSLGGQDSDPARLHRRIRLYSLSENYYRYLRSVLKDEQREESSLGDIGILEPVTIFSNVYGGTGIFGSACVSEWEFYIDREEVTHE